jgi:ATP-dependent DNA helicase RecG
MLQELISKRFKLQLKQKEALKKLGLETLGDLLFHFPSRYGDASQINLIQNLTDKQNAIIYGTIKNIKLGKTFKTKKPIASAVITDNSGTIYATWFSQPYLAKMFHEGSTIKLDGQISINNQGKKTMINPKIENAGVIPENISDSLFDDHSIHLSPYYRESRGVTSLWFYHSIQKILKADEFKNLIDPIDQNILEKYNLPNLKTALVWIHNPRKKSDAESARKRFAFQEVFFIQIQKQREKFLALQEKSYLIEKDLTNLGYFTKRFGFELTDSQKEAITNILKDLEKGHPMSRLLEGDVGSGKTAVASVVSEAVTSTNPYGQSFGNLQVAYMAPTEILAKQHFENFVSFFKDSKIKIGLLTSSGCKKFPSKINTELATNISKAQLLKWVANGEIPILIGTHSLIQKNVNFKHLALVIIDEQHRFGIEQRKKIARKEKFFPHLLSMTATPIPRTLTLTIFGDLDLTVIDQMPVGRKPIITEIILESERQKTYQKIKEELNSGRQAYVICPRISDPDPDLENKLNLKSVKSEAERLKKEIFPEFTIDILHSKMKNSEKDSVMANFESGETKILVATSVVEVGVNVPNATVIVIEGADRFGLAQLHQLRGRVIRSNNQAYCFVFTDSKSEKTINRLRALKSAKNGFELAEIDLQNRGIGELSGSRQWGLSDMAMEAIKNIKMVEFARNEAINIIEKDLNLDNYPLLKKVMSDRKLVHFE